MLQYMGSQRVVHDFVTEQQQNSDLNPSLLVFVVFIVFLTYFFCFLTAVNIVESELGKRHSF